MDWRLVRPGGLRLGPVPVGRRRCRAPQLLRFRRPGRNGVRLSGLTAIVFGSDYFGNELSIHLDLPSPNGSIIPTQIFAATRPNDGSSSVDPSIVRTQIQNELSVFKLYQDLEEELSRENDKILDELKSEALKTATDAAYDGLVELAAHMSGGPVAVPIATAIGVFCAIDGLGNLIAEAFSLAYVQDSFTQIVLQHAAGDASIEPVGRGSGCEDILP